MDLLKRVEKVFQNISEEFGIVYGIVFGSAAIGYRRKDSDLDVAVKLKKTPKTHRQVFRIISRISEAFEKELGIETDVIIMNVVDTGLKFEVFQRGKLVFYSKKSEYVQDSTQTVLNYMDMKPFFDQYFEQTKQRLFHG